MQSLGSVTFDWNPNGMSIPGAKKFVSSVQTYTSSAIFQWNAQWVGTTVELTWEYMREKQYRKLYALYLGQDLVEYDPDNRGETYFVIVTDMSGELFDTGLFDFPYRENVTLKMEIRAKGDTTSTTATTATTA
jgi:hypothetical protein